MRKNRDLIKLRKIIDKREETLEVISDSTRNTAELLEAVAIAEKQEKGEEITPQEKTKLKIVKEQYESFLDDSEVTETEGLKDALAYTIDDKKSYIDIDNKLKKEFKTIKKEIENNKESDKNKKDKGSLIDDYADLSDQMTDYIDD